MKSLHDGDGLVPSRPHSDTSWSQTVDLAAFQMASDKISKEIEEAITIKPDSSQKVKSTGSKSAATADQRRRRRTARLNVRARAKPPLRSLIRIADFLGLKTRKAIKAMAGDFDPEIRRLSRAHRPIAARWNVALAWICAAQIVLQAPVEKLLSVIRRKFLP